jgi:hypothetical protein
MTDAAAPPNVIILISYEYLNLSAVQTRLQALAPATFHIASKVGIGHTLLKDPSNLPRKWQPTRPYLDDARCDRALLFWDGRDPYLTPSARFFSEHHIPFAIIGPDAKEVALSAFYATFQNGDTKMSTTPAATPQVIVDAPAPPPQYGQSDAHSTARVRLQVTLPESTVAQYEAQAREVKLPVEKVMSDRLRSCVDHTAGRSLYFNSEQRATLERITGGHLIMDAQAALEKIRANVQLKLGDITIELTDRVLARCASRAKSERKTLEEYVKKEVIQGLERSTGLRPW